MRKQSPYFLQTGRTSTNYKIQGNMYIAKTAILIYLINYIMSFFFPSDTENGWTVYFKLTVIQMVKVAMATNRYKISINESDEDIINLCEGSVWYLYARLEYKC